MRKIREIASGRDSHGGADIDPDEVFQKAKMDILADEERDRIKDTLGEWLGEEEIRIKERLAGFGIGADEAEKVIGQIKKDLSTELRVMGVKFELMREKIKEKLPAIKANPEVTDEQKVAIDLLAQLSRLAFTRMIGRKLRGEASGQEIIMLSLLSGLNDKYALAHHDPFTEEIHLSIFNESKLSDYQKSIDHELTHFAFNKKVPQAAGLRVRGQLEVVRSKDRTILSMPLQFSSVLLAINESAAYLVGGRIPSFETYADVMPPRMFSDIYAALKKKLADVPRADYDRVLLGIYESTAAKWCEDMKLEDITKIVLDLKKE